MSNKIELFMHLSFKVKVRIQIIHNKLKLKTHV